MITLGIIGVVAAMTMPALITNYQKKQTAAQLKKAYSTFAQAFVQSQYENWDSSVWSATEASSSYEDNLKYFETYWKPYLKVIKICKTMKDCGYSSNNGYGYLTNKDAAVYGTYNKVPGFIYGDGTYAYIRPFGWSDTKLQLLSIDINGPKKPNIIGKDVFQFKINTQKGVISGYYGDNDKDLCTKEQINTSEAYRACGGKIMADGWEINDDYPW